MYIVDLILQQTSVLAIDYLTHVSTHFWTFDCHVQIDDFIYIDVWYSQTV